MWPVLLIIVLVIVVGALTYTLRVGKTVDTNNSVLDKDNDQTRKHPNSLNPAFLAYIIGFGGLLIFVAYLALKYM